ERKEFAIGGKQQLFRRALGEERLTELVVGLEGETREITHVALHRADPALVGYHDGDRLALNEGLLDRGEIVLGRIRKAGAALAERGLRSEHVADLLHLLADLGSLVGLRSAQALDAFSSARRSLSSP